MDQKSGPRLLNKRNILAAVLVAGIAAGIYLSDYLKGLGGGWGPGSGGAPSTGTTATTTPESSELPNLSANVDPVISPEPEIPPIATPVLKVLIADRSYSVRYPEGDQAAELKQIVALAKTAKGDEDGIRVRVYRRLSSRTSAELELRDALIAAGINEDQTVWVANPVDD